MKSQAQQTRFTRSKHHVPAPSACKHLVGASKNSDWAPTTFYEPSAIFLSLFYEKFTFKLKQFTTFGHDTDGRE